MKRGSDNNDNNKTVSSSDSSKKVKSHTVVTPIEISSSSLFCRYGFQQRSTAHPYGTPHTNDSKLINKYAGIDSFVIKDVYTLRQFWVEMEAKAQSSAENKQFDEAQSTRCITL